ncbi:ABC transporter substrate-binding protein [Saccharicrinis aurantiacus]|uniref:ABC transporter substrate-binding protein n=1 Tax=Saccharicrinis aurantiacus TaxID=1849719 RepID=UPI00249183DA|nr:ABC transporter substrate-binding protein [Saccharicrinis aurantiacus]
MIDMHTNIEALILQTPECEEFLYPFMKGITSSSTLLSISKEHNVSVEALQYGLSRTIKRAEQNPLDYEQMRNRLIKPGHLNVAGFVNFLWQNEFINALETKAAALGINLNLNIFPKHSKKTFQNYLAVCDSPNDLPELLIGKGFSSLMSQRFVDKFVKSGNYAHPSVSSQMGNAFERANFRDVQQNYHPFGVEEMVMIRDKTIPFDKAMPQKWLDLLQPQYTNAIMQMGKSKRDHFGFNMMLYLHTKVGEQGIRQYANNVKNKQHFSYIIKNMARNNHDSALISIVHQFTENFIRSDAKQKTELLITEDGNPSVCHFYLMKNNASHQAIQMAQYFYSSDIKAILEKCGTAHITSDKPMSGSSKTQWVGWDTIKNSSLPFLKEELSEVAFQHFACH